MGVIGESLSSAMTVGVLVGLVGIVMATVNYPIYKRLLNAGKKKYAFEIMELAREITEEQAKRGGRESGMNRSESKYFNTARRMDEALLSLLEEKDFAYITVREICARAGVNRSTFYLHYESMSDLLRETVEMIDERFRASVADATNDKTGGEQLAGTAARGAVPAD